MGALATSAVKRTDQLPVTHVCTHDLYVYLARNQVTGQARGGESRGVTGNSMLRPDRRRVCVLVSNGHTCALVTQNGRKVSFAMRLVGWLISRLRRWCSRAACWAVSRATVNGSALNFSTGGVPRGPSSGPWVAAVMWRLQVQHVRQKWSHSDHGHSSNDYICANVWTRSASLP